MTDPTMDDTHAVVTEGDREIGRAVFKHYLHGKLDDAGGEYEGEECAIHAAAFARLAAHADAQARVEVLEAENAMLKERGVRAVLAYHMAICAPKGVVPLDDLYDPAIATGVEQAQQSVQSTLNPQEFGS